MNKTIKDIVTLIAGGAAFWIVYQLVLIGLSLLIGLIVSQFLSASYPVIVIFCYAGLRMIEATLEIGGGTGAKCPECKRKIQTSRSVKCEVCGGAALITKKERKELDSKL
ncbi:hypothetical protein [Pelagicoccus mobilis]|uniref:Uncharacterized protein n=1 Tax=Pelagicoccus mobilis TaxID=415221 RepID=A0A934S6H3_9BACT|nr:hypothetical protein [Pelagicoccus mobilis]MBK1880617.1 hypothetical protein [Pelagicoccus mobilis]